MRRISQTEDAAREDLASRLRKKRRRDLGIEGWVFPYPLLKYRGYRVNFLLEKFGEKYYRLDNFVKEWDYEKEVTNWRKGSKRGTRQYLGTLSSPYRGIHGNYQEQKEKGYQRGLTKRVPLKPIAETLDGRHGKLELLKRELCYMVKELATESATQELTIRGMRRAVKIKENKEKMEDLWRQHSSQEEKEFTTALRGPQLEEKVEKVMLQIPTPLWKFDGHIVHPTEIKAPLSKAMIQVSFPAPTFVKLSKQKFKALEIVVEKKVPQKEVSALIMEQESTVSKPKSDELGLPLIPATTSKIETLPITISPPKPKPEPAVIQKKPKLENAITKPSLPPVLGKPGKPGKPTIKVEKPSSELEISTGVSKAAPTVLPKPGLLQSAKVAVSKEKEVLHIKKGQEKLKEEDKVKLKEDTKGLKSKTLEVEKREVKREVTEKPLKPIPKPPISVFAQVGIGESKPKPISNIVLRQKKKFSNFEIPTKKRKQETGVTRTSKPLKSSSVQLGLPRNVPSKSTVLKKKPDIKPEKSKSFAGNKPFLAPKLPPEKKISLPKETVGSLKPKSTELKPEGILPPSKKPHSPKFSLPNINLVSASGGVKHVVTK